MENTGTVRAILEYKGRDVYSISPDRTVYEAIERLADRNVGALLVMDGDRLIGIFSERDYTRKIALQGRHSKETKVHEIITGVVVTVTMSATIPECLQLMTDHRVRHLPVLEGDQVEGVISVGDLVNWIIRSQRAQIEQLHSYISGGYPG